MRAIETATTEELVRAMRAAKTALYRELAAQWGIGPVATIDVDRCMAIIAAYEHASGVTQVETRQLVADIKEGRKRGC